MFLVESEPLRLKVCTTRSGTKTVFISVAQEYYMVAVCMGNRLLPILLTVLASEP